MRIPSQNPPMLSIMWVRFPPPAPYLFNELGGSYDPFFYVLDEAFVPGFVPNLSLYPHYQGIILLEQVFPTCLTGADTKQIWYTVPLWSWTADMLISEFSKGGKMTEKEPEIQRWTAKRKSAVVLEVLKGKIAGVEACRKYAIKQSELEEWTSRFLESGENSLRSNPKEEQAGYEARIKELQVKVGELLLEKDVLKKRWDQIQDANRKT